MNSERETSDEFRAGISKEKYSSAKLQRAYELAKKAHEGQKRKSGEPYINHPVAVEKIIHEEWGIEDETIRIVALLHDTVEDTDLTLDEIRNEFGEEVATLVFAETNLEVSTSGFSEEKWKEIKDRENQRKILAGSYLDARVGVNKTADRLHNMRTLDSMSLQKRKQISQETLDVYAPLAEGLGMWIVKIQLEDLAFKHLHPEHYQSVKAEIDSDQRLTEYSTGYWKSMLQYLMDEENVTGEVNVKKDGYWSIVEKRRKASVLRESSITGFSDINDVISYRIALENENDCYKMLGVVHKQLGEIINFDRDDVFMWANKRDNGYQALQTTLETKGEGSIEIAIMTKDMEEFNNWGAVSLLREGVSDLNEYKLKLVFTPTGDMKFLKPQATGVDFAYKISESLGADASEMVVDGVRYPITAIIPNATVVEIITSEETRIAPVQEVLQYSLPETKRLIDKQLIIAKNQEKIVDARKDLSTDVLSKRGLLDLSDLDTSLRKKVLNRFGVIDTDSLCLKLAESSNRNEYVSKINKRLDELGVVKENMNLSTVQVTGEDKPGILVELSTWISENNGNVVKVTHETEGNRFELRLVVKGISQRGEGFIREKLEKDSRFDTWIVV
jgi:GTP pyrophosphokinase